MPDKKINHFLDIDGIDLPTLQGMLAFAKMVKSDEKVGYNSVADTLKRKQIALIFEKPSTRTRVSFEAAISKMGGNAIALDSSNTQLGRGETFSDTARVLSSYVDMVMLRCYEHNTLIELAKYSAIPIINGLTDYSHPCQVMADIMTFEEIKGSIEGKKVAWVGDCNNMTNSWIHASEKFGFELTIACPKKLAPKSDLPETVKLFTEPKDAVKDADLVNTDTWVSMGDSDAAAKKKLLKDYIVDDSLMKMAKDDALFMHCMPAHRGEEVSASVFDGPQSVVWEEAKNRLYIQEAIMLWCIGRLKGSKLISEAPFMGAKILVVEDNQSDLDTMKKILEPLGCEVTTAHDGQEALNKISYSVFDIIFMDCLMPMMNGFETTQAIRKVENDKKIKHTPIIGISTGSLEADQKRGLQAGMFDFINKPVSQSRITDLMKKWYKR